MREPTDGAIAPDAHAGFSLLELLVAITSLGVLVATVLLAIGPFRQQALETRCVADLGVVRSAAEAFEAQHERFPSSIAELVALGYLKDYPGGTSPSSDGAFVFVADSPPTSVTRPC